MKAIVCEMCNGNDVVKQGDYYVCQSCGTKYEPEAAKKLMVEIDNSAKLDNLYSLARRAKDEDNSENAAKYYGQILEHNPNDWEAYFYSAYYTAQNTTIANISSSAGSLARAVATSYQLLSKADYKQMELEGKAKEISLACQELVLMMARVSMNQLHEYMDIGAEAALKHEPEYKANLRACCNILIAVGDSVEKTFLIGKSYQSGRMKEIAVESWERALDLAPGIDSAYFESSIVTKIQKYKPEFRHTPATTTTSTATSSGGCYVATAVYGSYDCPEVWTLRRYRDYRLAETTLGRGFIRVYYAMSPHIVKWFGDSVWFKKMWRGRLDSMVQRLSEQGFANTPYTDRKW